MVEVARQSRAVTVICVPRKYVRTASNLKVLSEVANRREAAECGFSLLTAFTSETGGFPNMSYQSCVRLDSRSS